MIVTIPSRTQHEGYPGYLVTVEISDNCPVCNGPRATKTPVYKGLSYDGSRRLEVDCWENECGHVDTYAKVREEAFSKTKQS